MKVQLGICVLLLQAFALASAVYRPGMRHLSHHFGHHDHRLRDDICDEVERRHPHDRNWRHRIEEIKRMPMEKAVDELGDLLDSLDRHSRGEAEQIIRNLMAKWKLAAPRRYVLVNETGNSYEADLKCKQRGGKLAVIRNGLEEALAWEATFPRRYSRVHIGLICFRNRVTWRDGSPFNYEFERRRDHHCWSKKCGYIKSYDGDWGLDYCSTRLPFLCEFPANTNTTTVRSTRRVVRTTTSPRPRRLPTSKPPRLSTVPRRYELNSQWLDNDGAQRKCNERGGKLAVIRDSREKAMARAATRWGLHSRIHIGLVCRPTRVTWNDGTPFNFSIERNIPRNCSITKCGYIALNGQWLVGSCYDRSPFLCEFPLNTPRRYELNNERVDNDGAQRKCSDRGGELAAIRDSRQKAMAWAAARVGRHSRVHIGLVCLPTRVTWRDGTPFNFSVDRNIPRNCSTIKCGYIRSDGQWRVGLCYEKLPFLCEFPANNTRPVSVNFTTPRLRYTSKARTTPRYTTRISLKGKSTRRPFVTSTFTNSKVKSTSKPTTATTRIRLETEIRFTFDYDEVMKYPSFRTELLDEIHRMLNKRNGDVEILHMRRGSTIVRLRVYLNPGDNPNYIRLSLKKAAQQSGRLYQRFYGRLVPIIDPMPEPEPNNLAAILIPIFIFLVLAIILIVVLACCLLSKRKAVRPQVRYPPSINTIEIKDELPTYKEFTENDYTGPPEDPNAPPGYYDDCVKPPIA